jgi:hypothetical protein
MKIIIFLLFPFIGFAQSFQAEKVMVCNNKKILQYKECNTSFKWDNKTMTIKDQWGETYVDKIEAIRNDSIFFDKHIFIPQETEAILIYPNKKFSVFFAKK